MHSSQDREFSPVWASSKWIVATREITSRRVVLMATCGAEGQAQLIREILLEDPYNE